MINKKFRIIFSSLAVSGIILCVCLPESSIKAVDPGWETGLSSSSSSSQVNSSLSSSVLSSQESESKVESSSNEYISTGESIIENNESNGVSSSENVLESSRVSSSSEMISSVDSSSSTSVSSISSISYSKSELLAYLKRVYDYKLNEVNDANKQRILENNNKGALELQNAYKKLLKEIKSGKVTKEERQKLIESQKSSLQKVLSQRLNSLYDVYNQQVEQVRDELNKLDDNHNSNSKAIELDSKLVSLDYNLSVDSQKAYKHYDKELDKLNEQVKDQPVKSKKQQRIDAKNSYNANLNAISAMDPDVLEKDNKNRLKSVDELNKRVKSKIESGELSTPSEIDKLFR